MTKDLGGAVELADIAADVERAGLDASDIRHAPRVHITGHRIPTSENPFAICQNGLLPLVVEALAEFVLVRGGPRLALADPAAGSCGGEPVVGVRHDQSRGLLRSRVSIYSMSHNTTDPAAHQP